jgi:Ca2+-binding EF-hand superfamily protein
MVIKCFKKHANSEGKISKDSFKKILAGVMHEDLAAQVFDSFDRDHSGTMDVKEYLAMMGVSHGGTIEQKLRASFELFDKNGDGVLSKDEIRDMFISIVK